VIITTRAEQQRVATAAKKVGGYSALVRLAQAYEQRKTR